MVKHFKELGLITVLVVGMVAMFIWKVLEITG